MKPISPYRHLTTRALLAAKECVAWDRADLAGDPTGWAFPEQSAAYLSLVADQIDAELARRERRRHHPLAPAWADDRGGLEEIRRRIDLVTYVERTTATELHRVGRQLRGYCPFPDHPARSWGFVVHPEKQLWHCFGCLRGGDVFDFVEELFGLDFAAAADLLRREAGLLSRSSPATGTASGLPRLRVREVRRA